MFYVLATVDTDKVRVYNTDDRKYKDLTREVVEYLLQNGGEFKNLTITQGKPALLGNIGLYPKLITQADGSKALSTASIPTIVQATDQGTTTLVDPNGKQYQRYTRELVGQHFTNGVVLPGNVCQGYFEEIKYVESTEEAMEAFNFMLLGNTQELGFETNAAGEYLYKGEKKVKRLEVPEGVTAIAPNAFKGVSAVELILPKTVQVIKPMALNGLMVQKLTITGGALDLVDTGAFQGARIGDLYLIGQVPLAPLAFYGARIRKIFAQGKTYNNCLKFKIEATTSVKVLR